MIDGRLRALDSPGGLKRSAMSGSAWDVFAEPVVEALEALEAEPTVIRAGLAGDHLRAITGPEVGPDDLRRFLLEEGFSGVRQELVEPGLEDVFLSLAGED
jgi:hypothetical protein